jgi:DNA mismatch repair protein MSH5
MSLALRTTTKSSLVIVDEFGKGTAEADGLALLIATVEDFTRRGQNSPTIFLSTHDYSLMNHLDYSPLLKPQV